MDDDKQHFFMMSVEIRILASIMARISSRSIEERFSAHKADISGLQYGILRSLEHESSTLSELSRKFVLDPSTLVPVIDTLERKGFVLRGKDPADRRRVPISLTQGGVELIHHVPVVHEEDLLFQCLSHLGEAKTLQLQHLLRDVIAQMPEGVEMLKSVSSRLYSLHENPVTKPMSCDIYHIDEMNPESHPTLHDETDV